MIFQAGDTDEGRNLGASVAEATFASAQNFEQGQEYYRDLKARATLLGRDPEQILVMPGIRVMLADSDEQAQARETARRGRLDLDKALVELGRAFNYHDFSRYPIEGPFPDVANLSLNSYKGHAERIVRVAREQGLSLRETAWRFAANHSLFVGTAETVADEIERWFLGRAADGFNLMVSVPHDFTLFVERVVPILQARGLFRTDYEHDTLRGHLGLSVPGNRHARLDQAQAAE